MQFNLCPEFNRKRSDNILEHSGRFIILRLWSYEDQTSGIYQFERRERERERERVKRFSAETQIPCYWSLPGFIPSIRDMREQSKGCWWYLSTSARPCLLSLSTSIMVSKGPTLSLSIEIKKRRRIGETDFEKRRLRVTENYSEISLKMVTVFQKNILHDIW